MVTVDVPSSSTPGNVDSRDKDTVRTTYSHNRSRLFDCRTSEGPVWEKDPRTVEGSVVVVHRTPRRDECSDGGEGSYSL